MHEKRGFNRQQAIEYLGVKGRFFDLNIRLQLVGVRMGTAVVFDRVDLDRVFEEYRDRGDGQPTEKGASKWAERSPASTSTRMADGASTRSSEVDDFRKLSAQIIRKRRSGWLLKRLTRIRVASEGERPRFTFEEAACRYLREHQGKPSLEDEILYLKLAMPYAGQLSLDEICDETLAPLVSALKAPVVTKHKDGTETVRVRKNKTVNLVLGTMRQVLNLAARKWRVDGNRRLTWLAQAPLLTMLDLQDARHPKPITWAQQRILLPHLSDHMAQMALFVLNTGARDATVCSLRWEWEVRSAELRYSIFVVPRDAVIDVKARSAALLRDESETEC